MASALGDSRLVRGKAGYGSQQTDDDFQRHDAERRKREQGAEDRYGQQKVMGRTQGHRTRVQKAETAPVFRNQKINLGVRETNHERSR